MSYIPSENISWKKFIISTLIYFLIMFILIILITGIFTKFSVITLGEYNEYIKGIGKNLALMMFVIGFLTASTEDIFNYILKIINKKRGA